MSGLQRLASELPIDDVTLTKTIKLKANKKCNEAVKIKEEPKTRSNELNQTGFLDYI